MMKKITLLIITVFMLSSCNSEKKSWELDRTISLGKLPENVLRINFYNDTFGVAIDEYNSFYTHDGGSTWTKDSSFDSVCLEVIEIFNEDDYAVASCCFSTYASNLEQKESYKYTSGAITSISRDDDGLGWASSTNGRVYDISNNVVDEQSGEKIEGAGEIFKIHRFSDDIGYAVDTNYQFFKTENGGVSWDKVVLDINGMEKPLGSPILTTFKFLGENEIRIITYRQSLTGTGFTWHYFNTVDGGDNWDVEELLIDGLPNGKPEFSKDGNIITITATRRSKDLDTPTTFVLNHKDSV